MKNEEVLDQLYKDIAAAYMELLKCVDWNNRIFMRGIGEGLNKFVANAYLKTLKATNHRRKHLASQFISLKALEKIRNNDFDGLIFEHPVPKEEYIFTPCKDKAQNGSLTLDYINDLFQRYMVTVTITAEENDSLNSYHKDKMPENWDKIDIFARYTVAKIKFKKNPYLGSLIKEYKERSENNEG